MNKEIEEVIKEFYEKFIEVCQECGNSGVNTYGECSCSYTVEKHRLRNGEKARIRDFIAQAIKKAQKTAREEMKKEVLACLPKKREAFNCCPDHNMCVEDMENNIKKL